MNFKEYQESALKTWTATDFGPIDTGYLGLGLTGEAGEVAELLKKSIRHGITVDHEKLTSELGDVLWYVSVLSAKYGIALEEIAEFNIAKLKARYPQGFVKGGGIR